MNQQENDRRKYFKINNLQEKMGPGRDRTHNLCFCLFVALHPKSTALVMAGRSVHLTTLFPGQA